MEPLVHRDIPGAELNGHLPKIVSVAAPVGLAKSVHEPQSVHIEAVAPEPSLPVEVTSRQPAPVAIAEQSPVTTSRIRKLGSWALHPVSNFTAAQYIRNGELANRKGALLRDRLQGAHDQEHGEGTWDLLPAQEKYAAFNTALRGLSAKDHRQIRKEALEQRWQAMTPAERRKNRLLDGAVVAAVGITAAALTLRYLPGLVGKIADSWANAFGDPTTIPAPEITAIPDPINIGGGIGSDIGPDGATPTTDLPLFNQEQLAVTNNMGLYELFGNFGITDPASQAALLKQVGPALVDAGVAYKDPAIGGYGLNEFDTSGNPMALTVSQAQWLLSQYEALKR